MTGKCCCGVMSSTTGSKILAVLSIIGSVYSIVTAIFPNTQMENSVVEWRVLSGVWSVVTIIAALLVFLAISRRRSSLMVPMVGVTAVGILMLLLWIAMGVYSIFNHDAFLAKLIRDTIHEDFDEHKSGISESDLLTACLIFFNVAIVIGVLFSIWILSVFWDCYNYLKQEEFNAYHEAPAYYKA